MLWRTSFSCGYCDNHEISAPRSTIPCWMEKTTPGPPIEAAYCNATSRLVVVDRNAYEIGVQPSEVAQASIERSNGGREAHSARKQWER